MPIPQEILNVPRPTNTVVIAYGKNKDHYGVRQRIGCKATEDGRHLPVNGPTIGHIVDLQYVPITPDDNSSVFMSGVDLKEWANVVLCDKIFADIKEELLKVYNHHDMLQIYVISILRVCMPGIKDYELKEAYETSFLSELYPGVALSKNTVSTLLNSLGKTCSRIIAFMQYRAQAVNADHHLLIDGTLKSNESKVNTLSDFSRKAKTKGTRDISVVFAFDLELMEPICSKCFPGNMLDVTAYDEFIKENGIKKGIIVADKGLPASAIKDQLKENPDLHYLNPIKRNSKLIKTHDMYSFTGILTGYEGITYKKEKCSGINKWVYSFRESSMAGQEEHTWLRKAKKEGTYDHEKFLKRQPSFGTIVLESDLDLQPEIVYKAYSERWEIEIAVRFYKSACEFDETRVHDDYSVIGSEFCDFLSTLLTFRLLKEFDKPKLLHQMTYKKIMSILKRAKKVKVQDSDWKLIKLNKSYIEILQYLGILEIPGTMPRKRGRPKKVVI
ncbi:MAG: transposase [Oscillospiraceae bacterium]|nr:transposase [Oscillospiraceae bacterium]